MVWVSASSIWGFPKIRGTFFGVPIIRTITYWGLYWGPLILGNYHIRKLSRVLGFQGLGFQGLGFRVLGFRVLGSDMQKMTRRSQQCDSTMNPKL